jgi:serine/threonine protein kinase/formylglycine-generating enzyme required for sulfatase activity
MDKIGPYKILEPLGYGAVGKVDKAQAPDGRIVAVKTLFQQFTYETEYLKRFKQEAHLAQKLSHPNVVKILDVGEDNNGHLQYIVMEYVEGKTLGELMSGRSRFDKSTIKSPPKIFSAEETIRIMRQIAGVLQAAMDIGLLHRDIKPQNIMLDSKGNAKLLDFGLSKDCNSIFSILSTTGQFIGTPPYMSPEQHSGKSEVDHRSDLYSLGCTAYQMLTGVTPFPGPAVSGYALQHLNDIPPSVRSLNKKCPKNLSLLIARMLAKNPADRHQTPADLIEDLNRVERGEKPLKIHRPRKISFSFLLWRTAAAAILVLTLLVLAEKMFSYFGKDNKISFRIFGEKLNDAKSRQERPAAPEYKFTEAEQRLRLKNCLLRAERLCKNENKVKDAVAMVDLAYTLCSSEEDNKKVAAVEKKVYEALSKRRPWVAVVDFTVDKSVEPKVSGNAIAVKLEQELAGKFRLLTRSQVKKAMNELRFQTSDLIDRKNAKKFGKLVGAELLLTGSVIQLGQEITIATQCFDVETGIILQTAEVSMFNPGEINAKLFDLAAILTLDKASKQNHLNKKIDILNKRKIKYELARSEGERVYEAALNMYSRSRSVKDRNDLAYKYSSDALNMIRFFEKSSYSQYLSRKEKDKFKTLKDKVNNQIALLSQGPLKDHNWTLPELKMDFIYIEPGKFYMGAEKGHPDERPRRLITLKNGYWLGKYEVTNGEFLEFIASSGYNGSKQADDNYLRHFRFDSSIPTGNNYPVCWVSWHNANAFCQWLTDREKRRGRLPKGYVYRLPTEAEWEFAARGGNKSASHQYSGSNIIDLVAWYGNKPGERRPHEVGLKSANELGLFDMSGNVWEICYDWYGNYLPYCTEDPKGSPVGQNKVIRGGGWYYNAEYCKVSNRHSCLPEDTYNTVGFRVALAKEIK